MFGFLFPIVFLKFSPTDYGKNKEPIFAPILGMRLTNLNSDPNFTAKEKREIRLMYSGNNENRNADILVKLLELGADPRAHSIHGYTPLHLAVPLSNYKVIQSLLSCIAVIALVTFESKTSGR